MNSVGLLVSAPARLGKAAIAGGGAIGRNDGLANGRLTIDWASVIRLRCGGAAQARGHARLRPMHGKTGGRAAPIAAWGLFLAACAAVPAAASEDCLTGAPAAPGGSARMEAARVIGDHQRTRLVGDLTATIGCRVFTLADPYRVVVDLPEVHFDLTGSPPVRGLVSAVRFGVMSPGHSRMVIDLIAPARIEEAFISDAGHGEPPRLVISMARTDEAAFRASTSALRRERAPAGDDATGSRSFVQPRPPGNLPVVVVDPGHGGIDTGTTGYGKVEKTITLAFAGILKEQLEETGLYHVVLTRQDDRFVSLSDRVATARANEADLMVSIHVNAFPRDRSVRGAMVFTVSEDASDRSFAELAESENSSDVLAGVDVAGEDSDVVTQILLDLRRRETLDFGRVFARHLTREIGRSTGMFKNENQTAGFKVLEDPTVPSALIELGYLTNKADAERVADRDWQQEAAVSMVTAIRLALCDRDALKERLRCGQPLVEQRAEGGSKP